MKQFHTLPLVAAMLTATCGAAHAVSFETESVSGSFDSTISLGGGMRLKSSSSDLITAGNSGGPDGTLAFSAGLGDQGNLNYGRNDFFTGYVKGSHELLLKLPADVRFMARANWVRDFTAARTTGNIGNGGAPSGAGADGLTDDARNDLNFKARLLDLWVSKTFDLGEQQARVRVGNQVVSWGESLFIQGGINSTNAVDVMRLSQPGTQLKEAVLPAPMLSVATGLGHGLNAEAYVQAAWNRSYMPPTGSYWSLVNGLGSGHRAYGFDESPARSGGQWGAALRWKPETLPVTMGAYAMNYHDKTPQFTSNFNNVPGALGWAYPEDRKLYGVSVNFPVGDWALGSELSYRPKEAVALNSWVSSCASQGGNCWVDEKKYQWNLTGLLTLQPSGTGGGLLKLLGATGGTLLAELAVIHFPGLQSTYGGDPIAAGAWGWGVETQLPASIGGPGTPTPVGSKTSWGYNFDFSLVYDGNLIPGWQVVPEIFYFQAVKGRTPTATGTFMEGAKSLNLTVSFVQNPANWQFAVNYAKFWGGTLLDQPYRDRNYVGVTLARNF